MSEGSLFSTEAEALTASGEIYRHFKGGIYRLVQRGVLDSETQAQGVVYEHLWPHEHRFWFRLEESFFGLNDAGEPRFARVR